MKIQVPIYENRFSKSTKRKDIEVNFPVCLINDYFSDEKKLHLIYLSENRQIKAYINIGIFNRIEISTFEIEKNNDLGAIYQANGFDNKNNKRIDVDYFKRLLEMEKSKLTEIINLL